MYNVIITLSTGTATGLLNTNILPPILYDTDGHDFLQKKKQSKEA
jgi:hypothetical protein